MLGSSLGLADTHMNGRERPEMVRIRCGHRGTALIEFALVCLLLFTILGGVIEFGLEFYSLLQLNHAARVGARSAATGDTVATIRSKIKNSAPTLQIQDGNINLRYSTTSGSTFTATLGDSGSENNAPIGYLIKVHVDIPYQRLISLVPGGTSRRLTGDAVMAREG